MNTKELMIGDWVKLTDPINKGEEVKVRTIYDNGYVAIDGALTRSIEPIPITEDILDKNFKDIAEPHQRIYGGRWVYYDEYIEIEITEYNEGIWQVDVDEVEMSGLPSWKMYVSNVHQLQHALRLCNFDKNIEI